MTGHLDTLVLERSSVSPSVGRRTGLWAGGAVLVLLLAGGAALFACCDGWAAGADENVTRERALSDAGRPGHGDEPLLPE